MKALNAKYMRKPRSGMIVKDEILLAPSHYYYHFAHSQVNGRRQKRDQIIGGAWWMDADVFNTIKQKAQSSESHISGVARRDLAVARRWGGKLDIVVRALVVGPLAAYIGVGTYQTFEEATDDDYAAWIPAREAVQIYIPGLMEKNPATGAPIYHDAFAHAEQIRIGWDPAR